VIAGRVSRRAQAAFASGRLSVSPKGGPFGVFATKHTAEFYEQVADQLSEAEIVGSGTRGVEIEVHRFEDTVYVSTSEGALPSPMKQTFDKIHLVAVGGKAIEGAEQPTAAPNHVAQVYPPPEQTAA